MTPEQIHALANDVSRQIAQQHAEALWHQVWTLVGAAAILQAFGTEILKRQLSFGTTRFEKLHERKLDAMEKAVKLIVQVHDLRMGANGSEKFHNDGMNASEAPMSFPVPGAAPSAEFTEQCKKDIYEAQDEMQEKLRDLDSLIAEKEYMFSAKVNWALRRCRLILGTWTYTLNAKAGTETITNIMVDENDNQLYSFNPAEYSQVYSILDMALREEFGSKPSLRSSVLNTVVGWYEKIKKAK